VHREREVADGTGTSRSSGDNGAAPGVSVKKVPAKIKVGEFEIALLSDGLWRNDGGCMFGVVPRELWKREHPADDRNRIRLNLVCPLIIRGGADAFVTKTSAK